MFVRFLLIFDLHLYSLLRTALWRPIGKECLLDFRWCCLFIYFIYLFIAVSAVDVLLPFGVKEECGVRMNPFLIIACILFCISYLEGSGVGWGQRTPDTNENGRVASAGSLSIHFLRSFGSVGNAAKTSKEVYKVLDTQCKDNNMQA